MSREKGRFLGRTIVMKDFNSLVVLSFFSLFIMSRAYKKAVRNWYGNAMFEKLPKLIKKQ